MKKQKTVYTLLKKISIALTELINKTVLLLAYLVGIGISSIFYKLLGKRFLNLRPDKSTWDTPSGSGEIDKMY